MLTNLYVSNIVLIDKLDIPFDNGFCVLTGETGAGKSILLDSLGLAIGNRSSTSLIRAGEKQGSVTASFNISNNPLLKNLLAEQGIDVDEEVLLRRVIFDDGKSKAFINDCPVSAGFVSTFAQQLIEIHGQHDQRGLLNPKTHRFLLDQFAKNDKELSKTKNAYQEYNSLKNKLTELKESEAKAASDEEYLKFVLRELEALSPRKGLEDELTLKRNMLLNRDKSIEAINKSFVLLEEGNVENILRSVQNTLISSVDINPKFDEISQVIDRAIIEVTEAVHLLNNEASKIDDSAENPEEIEERLFALKDAARKHNVISDNLEEYIEQVKIKLDSIANKDEIIANLEKEVAAAKIKYIEAATELNKSRTIAAKKIEKALMEELAPLKMENTKLKVEIEQKTEERWGADGFDKVNFLVKTNPGAPFAPISKIASGGELSRFVLALKVVLSDVKSVPTMIFDEVDTGIGGAVADAVGKRLAKLGNKLQVFAITHQPQVASKGNYHLKVEKIQTKNRTNTNVRPLTLDERREEIARMLAGDEITTEARSAAEKLISL
ncbi:MAG: DNA repair protein RecN [Rickettsiales bacterium]|nr:DNA repair protein RecN [Pseudomonadota bacterium]MDA0966290.1 DNA repair protein RecN [Pseudomonadota bacterium]MDG4543045.1 DNA repair protein RecN [Rickettsiales bacterium]MDG4545243.1 DNA repair protein RecN [Rickettsiales bacterium]MDG4547692.1 DNA repair protein RecN [Rickettsiales bacterium]